VLGALEHHVLEEVREAGAPSTLVQRADVIPEIDGDERQTMVLVRDDSEAVRQRVLLIPDLRQLQLLCWRGKASSKYQKHGNGGRAATSQSTSHRWYVS